MGEKTKTQLKFILFLFIGIIFTGTGFEIHYKYNSLFASFIAGLGMVLLIWAGVILGINEKKWKLLK